MVLRIDSIEELPIHIREVNPDLAAGLQCPSVTLGRVLHPVEGQGGIKGQVSKYHAVRTEYNGRWYPSKKQAGQAAEFYLQKKVGAIKGVLEEVPFRLPGKTRKGRPIIHRVDFGIIELDDRVIWYESKGKDLELGRLKRAQTEEIYQIKIHVI